MSICPYFLVENSQKDTVIPLSLSITLLSTIINFIGFYVILKKSKKETKLFRFVLFGNQFFLWLSQGFWAVSMNTTSLFPFPALYSISPFNDIFTTHQLFRIWLVFLSLFAVFMVAMLVVRHRMVVRSESLFNCPQWFYISFLVGGWMVGLSVLIVIWSFCNSPESEKFSFVQENFPTCQNVFLIPGVLIITKVYGVYSLLALMVLIGIAAELVYIIASCIVLFELSKQTRKMSSSTLSHHKKIVIDTSVQIVIKTLFLATWAFWLFATYFLQPEVDTRVISLIINSLFVAAPIPGTIAMFIQNTVYRRFLLEKLKFRLRNHPSVNPQSQYAVNMHFSAVT